MASQKGKKKTGLKRGNPSPPENEIREEIKASIKDEICTRLIEGETLSQICRSEHIPEKRTILRWLATDAEFAKEYSDARDALADYWADQVIEIADEAKGTEGVAEAQLRIKSRMWSASKVRPGKYGNRIVNADGSDGVAVQVQIVEFREEDCA